MIVRKTIVHPDGARELLPDIILPENHRWGRFLNSLEYETIPGGDKIRVQRPMDFVDRHGVLTSVAEGFICDLFSIPRAVKWLFGDIDGAYAPDAVLHDHGYSAQDRPREEYDTLLYESMRALCASWIKARIVWTGVQSFGEIAWQINAQEVAMKEVIGAWGLPAYVNPHQSVLQMRWAWEMAQCH
jgi:hypothetical protein